MEMEKLLIFDWVDKGRWVGGWEWVWWTGRAECHLCNNASGLYLKNIWPRLMVNERLKGSKDITLGSTKGEGDGWEVNICN